MKEEASNLTNKGPKDSDGRRNMVGNRPEDAVSNEALSKIVAENEATLNENPWSARYQRNLGAGITSLNRYDASESEEKDYDIIAADFCLKYLGGKRHLKGESVLKIDSDKVIKGTKFVHTQDNGINELYDVWAFGSAKIAPALKHDMEISDNILSVVKKMEVPRLTLGELVAKLSALRTVKER